MHSAREFHPKNFSRQDANIQRFYPVVMVRGPTTLSKLLMVTPNDAEMGTLTDIMFYDVITEIER